MFIPIELSNFNRKKATRCASDGVGCGAELILELALPFCDARSLAAVGATSRSFHDLIFAPSSLSEDIWAGALHMSAGKELASGAGKVLAQLGGASYRSLAASASSPAPLCPLTSCQLQCRGTPPSLTLSVGSQPPLSDADLRSICVAAVEWLLWGSEGQLLWSSGPTCRLLCTRLSSPKNKAVEFRMTGEVKRWLNSLDAVANVVTENILADCWALQVNHSTCPEIAARWSYLNFDCLEGGDGVALAEASRGVLCGVGDGDDDDDTDGDGGWMIRRVLAEGCSVSLVMAAGGEPGEGVRYEYCPDDSGSTSDPRCWIERGHFNYRTNAHGLLATLWQETKNSDGGDDQDTSPFVVPSKWEGWPWSLHAA